ncbi:transcription termination factor 4, mitochondrial isoform X3 [Canis lupus baileyi]|uniref:transcription termination factor 4, mitochondrial isoform X3 n=1 Tax=Canis lupus baileyi TaxID=143281 RepID=UPI003B97B075
MAALGGQVLGGARTWARTWPRTWARTWAGLAAQPRGGQRRTAASRGGGRGARGPGARGEVAGALLAMGFSDAHVRGLLSVWRGARPRRVLDVVSELILLGVSPEHVCLALRSSPRLLDLPAAHAQRRSGYLRRLGLGEGKLKTLLLCCPEVFTMHQRDIENIVGVLKDKCLFTGQQVTRILHRCPYVLREDPGDLEYKFQSGLCDGAPACSVSAQRLCRRSRAGRPELSFPCRLASPPALAGTAGWAVEARQQVVLSLIVRSPGGEWPSDFGI